MFDLVADVERYSEFLPWCVGARITRREGRIFWADLLIGFTVFREKFTSRVTLTEDKSRIDTEYAKGPFRHLKSHWLFRATDNGTDIEFYIEFEVKSGLIQRTIETLFHEAVRRMVGSFEARAYQLYR